MNFLKTCFFLQCVWVHGHQWVQYWQRPEEGIWPWGGIEVTNKVSPHVGAGNQTQNPAKQQVCLMLSLLHLSWIIDLFIFIYLFFYVTVK